MSIIISRNMSKIRVISSSVMKYNYIRNISTVNKLTRQQISCKRQVNVPIPSIRKYSGAYEGEGKTTVQILNKEMDLGLMINSYSQYGFRLNNDMVIVGPMLIFPRSVLSWNIANYNEINEASLSLFHVLEPKLDVLVIGVGDQNITPDISKRIINYMKKYNINVELLKTEQACTTFNFLNAEGRVVGAAMIPPNHITINENDLMRTQIRQNHLYSIE